MNDKTIETIIYEFDPDAILGDLPEDEYDIAETKRRFKELCHAELQRFCPTADIEIKESFGSRYLVNGIMDHSEVPEIEDLCLKIWITQDYLVRCTEEETDTSTYYSIRQGGFIPTTGLLRWSCKNGLIDGANRNGLVWTLTKASCHKFQRMYIKGDPEASTWLIRLSGNTVSSITSIDQRDFLKLNITEALQEGLITLVCSDVVPMPAPFQPTNSYFLFSLNNNKYQVTVVFFDDVEAWEHLSGYTFSRFSNILYEIARSKRYSINKLSECDSNQPQRHSIEINFPVNTELPNNSIEECVAKCVEQLKQLVEDTEIKLKGGLPWEAKYGNDESEFRDRYLKKLLELLGYDVVKLEHGPFEFGKDIIFAETTRFGVKRYYALQAKKGDLSGDAKNDMDIVMNQLEDAFAVPFRESQTLEHKFISGFVIAISGKFRNNAQEKVWARLLRQGRVGMVYFWDKDVVQDLMRVSSLPNSRVSAEAQKNMMPNFLKTV